MNKRNIVFKMVSVLLGIVVAVLAGEILLWILHYDYVPLRISRLGEADVGLGFESDWRSFHSQQDTYVVYDPNLIWRPKNGYQIFNSQGFRAPEPGLVKGVKEYRIFTIGDSNTIGPFYSPGWPDYLRQLLAPRYPRVRVINAGVWGYTSWQGLKRFEEILKYDPDMVLISFGANDAHRVTVSDKAYIANKKFFGSKLYQLRICKLLVAASDVLMLKKRSANPFIPRVSLQEYSDNLNKIIVLAKERGIKVILLTRPFTAYFDDEEDKEEAGEGEDLWWRNFGPQYNELTAKIALEAKVELIDVHSFFKDTPQYFFDEGHFNDEGYRVAAKLIYPHIVGMFKTGDGAHRAPSPLE